MTNPFEYINCQIEELIKSQQEIKDLLTQNSLKNISQFNELDDQKFSMEELAIYLKRSISTIKRYKKNEQLPYHSVGKTIFFKKREVDDSMSSIKLKKRKNFK